MGEEVAASEARFASGGAGLWAARERGAAAEGTHERERRAAEATAAPLPSIVGFVGFRPFFDPPELQLLYGLLPSHWGRGLATEAAMAATAHALDVLGVGDVRAATDVPNTASITVLERLGFVECRRTDEGATGTAYFRLDAEAWGARRR